MKKEETNLYTITIPPMTKSLKAIAAILDKAGRHAGSHQMSWHPKGMQEGALLNARLIADQFNLIRQIQVACDNAKNGVARIAGVKAPAFEDNEMTVKELKSRIDKTVKFLKTIKPQQMIGQEDKKVSLPYAPKKMMTSFGYATGYLIPNFYAATSLAFVVVAVELGVSDGLRVIAVAGAGTDAIDREAAARRGVEVLAAGEALTETTADIAFGLVISASRLMHEAETVLRTGR